MKKLLAFFALISTSFIMFAQDSTDTTGAGSGGADLIPGNIKTILLVFLGVFEVVARFLPTVKNYSIIGWVIKLIQTFLPNRSTTAKPHP